MIALLSGKSFVCRLRLSYALLGNIYFYLPPSEHRCYGFSVLLMDTSAGRLISNICYAAYFTAVKSSIEDPLST